MSADLFGVEHVAAKSVSSHEVSANSSDEWLTPQYVTDALGAFDLDPCSPGDRRPWDTAMRHLSVEDDGLRAEWSGRVWCNPPYSSAARWLGRMAEHDHGTALIFARTETRLWFDHVWSRASGLLFLKGRIRFCYVSGKAANAAGAPSVLVAYGKRDADVLASLPLPGHYVPLKESA